MKHLFITFFFITSFACTSRSAIRISESRNINVVNLRKFSSEKVKTDNDKAISKDITKGKMVKQQKKKKKKKKKPVHKKKKKKKKPVHKKKKKKKKKKPARKKKK